jgi:hypothetical protein
MDVPRRVLEEAVQLMRQSRGNAALDRVRDYGITTFGQLEFRCRENGIPSWREDPPVRAEESKKDEDES